MQYKNSITFKLILINLILYLAAGIIIASIVYSYQQLNHAVEDELEKQSGAIAINNRVSSQLATILSQSGYLRSAFYRNDTMVRDKGEEILSQIQTLQENVADERLLQLLQEYNKAFADILHQCEQVNEINRTLVALNSEYADTIIHLDEEIAARMIDMMIAGEEVTSLQQLTVITPQLDRSFLLIKLELLQNGLEHFSKNSGAAQHGHVILNRLNELSIRLQSLSSPIEAIDGSYKALRHTVQQFHNTVTTLPPAVSTFMEQQTLLEERELGLFQQLEQVDVRMTEVMSQTSSAMMTRIKRGGVVIAGIALLILLSVSLLVFLFGGKSPVP